MGWPCWREPVVPRQPMLLADSQNRYILTREVPTGQFMVILTFSMLLVPFDLMWVIMEAGLFS